MNKLRKALTLAMAAAVVLVMLLSASFVAENAGHHCEQDACPICQQLEACEATLHAVAAVAVVAVFSMFFKGWSNTSCCSNPFCVFFSTPVSLKVKLSN